MHRRLPLAPARMSPDSVALDVFFIRVPHGDATLNGPLWDEIDEQSLPVELRRDLAEHGLRAGILGGRLPLVLEQWLRPSEQAPQDPLTETVDFAQDDAPPVLHRYLQTRKGQRCEILASGVYPRLALLVPSDEGLIGRTYSDGQGVFSLDCLPLGDGRVRVKLTPEVHHGETAQRVTIAQGRMRIEPGRARDVFDDLALCTVLSPGQMLLLTHLPQRAGSLGWYFFTDESTGQRQQKLLLLRVAQTQYDDKFSDEILPVEDDAAGAGARLSQ